MQTQQFQIGFFGVFGPFEHGAKYTAHALDDCARVTNDERADCRAQNNDKFERLPKHVKLAAHSSITAKDAQTDRYHADYEFHLRDCPLKYAWSRYFHMFRHLPWRKHQVIRSRPGFTRSRAILAAHC